MYFRIESTGGVNPAAPAKTADELRARLEAALQHWVETQPQTSDNVAEAARESFEQHRNISVQPQHVEAHQAALAAKIKTWRDTVKANSAKLDAIHSEVVAWVKPAIEGAVAQAEASGKAVRVSIHGHVDAVSDDGVYQRARVYCSTDVNLAQHN